MKYISVIGLDGVSAPGIRATELLMEANTVLASSRLKEVFSSYEIFASIAEKIKVFDKVEDTLGFIRISEAPCAVLASGDPMFFGIGTKICEALSDSNVQVEIHPAISSVQMAFARLGLPWHDAEFISLHGATKRQWSIEDLPLLASRHSKLVILTGGENTPQVISGNLPPECRVFVLERLGSPEERITKGSPEEISAGEYSDPNIMIVLAPAPNTPANTLPVFGLREDELRHERGLITKDEVRAVALHKLRLPQTGVLWDIGAGSGSVGIEARRMNPALEVYAIERDEERAKDIHYNAYDLGAGKITVINAEAPGALHGLPVPDRIFIGGSGTGLQKTILAVNKIMKNGIIVASAITIESLGEAVAILKQLELAPEVTSIAVARSRDVAGRQYLKAENQVFLIKAEKKPNE